MLVIKWARLLKYISDHSVSCIKPSAATVEYEFQAGPGSAFRGQNEKSGLLGRGFPVGHNGGEASVIAHLIVWN